MSPHSDKFYLDAVRVRSPVSPDLHFRRDSDGPTKTTQGRPLTDRVHRETPYSHSLKGTGPYNPARTTRRTANPKDLFVHRHPLYRTHVMSPVYSSR